MSPYAKAIYLFAAAILAAAVPLVTQGHLTQAEGVNFAILVVGTALTYLAPEVPTADVPYVKSVAAALVAALTVLASFIQAGGSLGAIPIVEWVQIVGAFMAVLLGPIHQAAFPAPQKAAA